MIVYAVFHTSYDIMLDAIERELHSICRHKRRAEEIVSRLTATFPAGFTFEIVEIPLDEEES